MEAWREALVGLALVLVLIVAGCGGGDASGSENASSYTKDDIASALGFRHESHETLYERAPGKDCVVLKVLTSSGEVEAAQRVDGDLPTALAVNSNGDVAVMFSGFGTFLQDECVAPAESDLNSLSD